MTWRPKEGPGPFLPLGAPGFPRYSGGNRSSTHCACLLPLLWTWLSMTSSTQKPKIQVQVVPNQLPRILERAGDDADFKAQLERASVVLVPEEGYPRADGPVFPPNTEPFFAHLRDGLPESLTADLAVQDEDYMELGLHADELWLPTLVLFVGGGAQASLVINVVSSYVYDWIKRGISRKDGTVKSKVLINRKEETVSIEYEGPPEAYQAAVLGAVEAVFRDGARSDGKNAGKKR